MLYLHLSPHIGDRLVASFLACTRPNWAARNGVRVFLLSFDKYRQRHYGAHNLTRSLRPLVSLPELA